MRYFFFILLIVCFNSPVLSQTNPNHKGAKKDQEQKAEIIFCGPIEIEAKVDIQHWRAYLEQNLQLDSLAPPGTYSITATFIIGKNGCIDEVKILSDPGYGLGKKAAKVIAEYQQWFPAERNGRKVKAYRKQVITIIVEEEEECEEKLSKEFIL